MLEIYVSQESLLWKTVPGPEWHGPAHAGDLQPGLDNRRKSKTRPTPPRWEKKTAPRCPAPPPHSHQAKNLNFSFGASRRLLPFEKSQANLNLTEKFKKNQFNRKNLQFDSIRFNAMFNAALHHYSAMHRRNTKGVISKKWGFRFLNLEKSR